MARQKKTPRQRAEEQLAAATRIATRLGKKVAATRVALEDLEEEQRAANARRDYLANHPDLSSTPTATTEENDA